MSRPLVRVGNYLVDPANFAPVTASYDHEKGAGEVMDYLAMLEHSFKTERERGYGCPPESRLRYLAENIFDFTTYEDAMDELFAGWAVKVVAAITDGTTFDMCRVDNDHYTWYLLMCNMPFFASRIEWGGSVRGAWWSHSTIEFQSCGLWIGSKQLAETMKFTHGEWKAFMHAVAAFAAAK